MKHLLLLLLFFFSFNLYGQKVQTYYGVNLNTKAINGVGIGGDFTINYKPIQYFGIGVGFSIIEYNGLGAIGGSFYIPDVKLDLRGNYPFFGKNEVFIYSTIGKPIKSDKPQSEFDSYIKYNISFGAGLGYSRSFSKHSGLYLALEYNTKKVREYFPSPDLNSPTLDRVFSFNALNISLGYTFSF